MTVIDYPSPNHSRRPDDIRVDTIVLHHTATKYDRSALRWLCSPEAKASAHYLIGDAGHVYRLVSEDRMAWHAGESRMPWSTSTKKGSINGSSIGIELVNPGDGKTPFTEAQYVALGELLRDIVHRLMIRTDPADHGIVTTSGMRYILGHRDVAPGRKTDPADNFDWARVRKELTFL